MNGGMSPVVGCGDDKGTMRGYALHSRSRTVPCLACMKARWAYANELFETWGITGDNRRIPDVKPGRRVFIENYLWLIATGETHPETIARRMGMKAANMERRLFRYGLTPLHLTTTIEVVAA